MTNQPAKLFSLKKGLRIAGGSLPTATVIEQSEVNSIALLGCDFPSLRPNIIVSEGEKVSVGDVLISDRKREGIIHRSPIAGTVTVINWGERRSLTSLVIRREDSTTPMPDPLFEPISVEAIRELTASEVRARLLQSGLWIALRQRPFGVTADPKGEPKALFITATDHGGIAGFTERVFDGRQRNFLAGVWALSRMSDAPIILCISPGVPVPEGLPGSVQIAEFSGPYPAGLPGTHMHFLNPVGPGICNWHVDCQDVIAMGLLFTAGRIEAERVIALTGLADTETRLVQTILGASLDEISNDNPVGELPRAGARKGFLGRYQTLSRLNAVKNYGLSSSSPMLASEALDAAMPLDILPAPLMRALSIGDWEQARRLGALELIEEDIAHLGELCASGRDYGALLRDCLSAVIKEDGI